MKRVFQILAVLLVVMQSAWAASLNQAAFNRSANNNYVYGYNSIPNMKVTGAPRDTDWRRWAMLHDGSTYRLYFFRKGTNNKVYQFGFNRRTSAYEYGYNSIPVLTLTGVPYDADASQFSMLHDGSTYRLYLRKQGSASTLYQFGFNRATNKYEYGYNSIPKLKVTGMPQDTDWNRTAMLHDGSAYRFYAMKRGSNSQFYQAAFNRQTNRYEFGFNSIRRLTVTGMPRSRGLQNMAMLHDGRDYRFYHFSR